MPVPADCPEIAVATRQTLHARDRSPSHTESENRCPARLYPPAAPPPSRPRTSQPATPPAASLSAIASPEQFRCLTLPLHPPILQKDCQNDGFDSAVPARCRVGRAMRLLHCHGMTE